MRPIYSLLHFQHKTAKHLLLSIHDTVPDADKQEALVLSIVAEGSVQAFTLNSSEINDFVKALSYGAEMLQWRRIRSINAKYSTINKK